MSVSDWEYGSILCPRSLKIVGSDYFHRDIKTPSGNPPGFVCVRLDKVFDKYTSDIWHDCCLEVENEFCLARALTTKKLLEDVSKLLPILNNIVEVDSITLNGPAVTIEFNRFRGKQLLFDLDFSYSPFS